MFNLIDNLLQGVLLGGLYALFATGLSLAFGIMRFVNIAHGDFIVIGAFASFALIGWVPMLMDRVRSWNRRGGLPRVEWVEVVGERPTWTRLRLRFCLSSVDVATVGAGITAPLRWQQVLQCGPRCRGTAHGG